ncbi:IPT/TIG domain-containing protein [Siphonobacter sp. SORGH_AS_0500]|uniref:IPT/TIG domain-containing protein n=1 Tax=Siphonobacter sp. SORGH_AS_0500 TaxID=1864824 RepID=UPI00285FA06F|nr:IPT/TIG domain-containing protein [Siphonobacter sp. SORGH_AS_0500]MDR6197591.1 hypothetical protein [Siphonobacter sp. SORGH_AS_0500]
MKALYMGLAALSMGLLLSSCEPDTDGRPQVKPGTPVATTIAPDSAAGGTVVTLRGTGLGDMRSIVLEKDNVAAGIMPTLNTEDALIFRIPDEAIGGSQNITFTNSLGRAISVPFRVLAYPTVTEVSNYNFTKGSQITLTGNNLDDVTSVKLTGTTVSAKIISKAKKQLTIEMPATTTTRTTLDILNSTGPMKTTQEFVNLEQAYPIFLDAYGTGITDASWGDAAVISTKEFKSGTASVGKTYQKGNWHLIGFSLPGLAYASSYTYVSGWIKGASADYSLYLTTDASKEGFGNYVNANKIDVKAGTWTYFKIKISDADFWSAGKTLKSLGFRIQGPDKQDETFYFDDIILVK